MTGAYGITAHILTLHCDKNVGKVSNKTQVSQLYPSSLYMLVISVPDPLSWVVSMGILSDFLILRQIRQVSNQSAVMCNVLEEVLANSYMYTHDEVGYSFRSLKGTTL